MTVIRDWQRDVVHFTDWPQYCLVLTGIRRLIVSGPSQEEVGEMEQRVLLKRAKESGPPGRRGAISGAAVPGLMASDGRLRVLRLLRPVPPAAWGLVRRQPLLWVRSPRPRSALS